jgi:hypothetical protein
MELVPRGTLPRFEVLFAVILGLTLFRNYGPGPFRQNAARLLGGAALGLSLVFWSRIWSGISILGAIGFVFAIIGLGITLFAGRALVQYIVSAVRPPLPGAGARRDHRIKTTLRGIEGIRRVPESVRGFQSWVSFRQQVAARIPTRSVISAISCGFSTAMPSTQW